jgi:predicted RNA-binding protein Jag
VTGLRAWWEQRKRRHRAEEEEREDEEQGMSPAERKFIHESVEGHAADAETSAHLGGTNPNRLLGD